MGGGGVHLGDSHWTDVGGVETMGEGNIFNDGSVLSISLSVISRSLRAFRFSFICGFLFVPLWEFGMGTMIYSSQLFLSLSAVFTVVGGEDEYVEEFSAFACE
jgi:hypothetical protein